MTEWLLTFAAFLIVLAVLGAVADWWDRSEARDSRRRNGR